jgi:hypothetical protein
MKPRRPSDSGHASGQSSHSAVQSLRPQPQIRVTNEYSSSAHYEDATQVFEADGGTTYVENGRPTRGEWYVDDDGHFGSFWPPSYRASYDLRWIVEEGIIVGLRFTELGRGSRFERVIGGVHPCSVEGPPSRFEMSDFFAR